MDLWSRAFRIFSRTSTAGAMGIERAIKAMSPKEAKPAMLKVTVVSLTGETLLEEEPRIAEVLRWGSVSQDKKNRQLYYN